MQRPFPYLRCLVVINSSVPHLAQEHHCQPLSRDTAHNHFICVRLKLPWEGGPRALLHVTAASEPKASYNGGLPQNTTHSTAMPELSLRAIYAQGKKASSQPLLPCAVPQSRRVSQVV